MTELPRPNDPGQPGHKAFPSTWLLVNGNIPVVPGLVQESNHENNLEGTHTGGDPDTFCQL